MSAKKRSTRKTPPTATGLAEESATQKRATILTAGSQTPIKSWPGLFDLYQDADGAFRAEFGTKTAPLAHQLDWSIDEKEHALSLALAFLAMPDVVQPILDLPQVPEPKLLGLFGASNAGEIWGAAQRIRACADFLKIVFEKFRDGIGDEIAVILDSSTSGYARTKAKQDVAKTFKSALEALDEKNQAVPHRKAAAVLCCVEGDALIKPLSWVVLQCARQLVEAKQELPTKREVRQRVEKLFPFFFVNIRIENTAKLTDTQWNDLYKRAGIGQLPHATNWSNDHIQ